MRRKADEGAIFSDSGLFLIFSVETIAVFDLNQTLYSKPSKDEFFKFVCFKKPHTLWNSLQIAWWYFLKNRGLIGETRFKENFFNYLDGIHPDKVAEYARDFWRMEFPKHFNADVLAEVERLKREGIKCCICSGAMAVYMNPLKEFLPMDRYISTKTVYKGGTYKIVGESCDDTYKLVLIREVYGDDVRILEAYSDQAEPMLDAAEKPFMVENGKIRPYVKKES
jgi:phosphoserine phosphatase